MLTPTTHIIVKEPFDYDVWVNSVGIQTETKNGEVVENLQIAASDGGLFVLSGNLFSKKLFKAYWDKLGQLQNIAEQVENIKDYNLYMIRQITIDEYNQKVIKQYLEL